MKLLWPSLEQVWRAVSTGWIVFLSLAQSYGPNTYTELENIQGNQFDLLQCYIFPWCAQLDALLIRYQKTGHPSGWKLCQFILQNVLSDFTGYANSIGLFIINRLSSVTMLWTQSMFSTVVSVAGHPDIGSSSRHSVPLLNSAALFCTVDKTGESSLM